MVFLLRDLNFIESFRALTAGDGEGHDPFLWQERLYKEMCSGEIPDALDIPTGLGKTAIIAIWLLARARCPKQVPRRLIYVVDRRVVVDQATVYARLLREALDNEKCGHIRNIREALGLEGCLPISTLRGQFADNREWLSDIVAPAIVVGTVDMVGSRVLFRGYGVPDTMRPMQAALLATDSLMVLDEAHLSLPFERLMKQVACRTGPDGVRLMALSATHMATGNAFCLTEQERSEDLVHQRLEARKVLTIEDKAKDKAKPKDFSTAAWGLLEESPGARILVYRHEFKEAVEIVGELQKLVKKEKRSDISVTLLTGRRRGLERDALVGRLEEDGFFGGRKEGKAGGAILVATSAGEVGVDLDADHMLCDLVPWERMVQRLGRVNRRGEGDAKVMVWDIEEESIRRKDTRKLLECLKVGNEAWLAGPGKLARICRENQDRVQAASTPGPPCPALTDPLVDAWAMTSLRDHAGRPEVGPWLHGWEETAQPTTTIVWRKYLPVHFVDGEAKVDSGDLKDWLAAAPIRPSERLEAPSKEVRIWLKKLLEKSGEAETAQLIALVVKPDGTLAMTPLKLGSYDKFEELEELIKGCTLIVHQHVAGLDCDRTTGQKKEPVAGTGVLDEKRDEYPPTADTEPDRFRDTGWRVAKLEPDGDVLVVREERPQVVARFVTRHGPDGEEREGFAVLSDTPAGVESEDALSLRRRKLTLCRHSDDVERQVADYACRLGLDDDLTEALRIAARYHDAGKAAKVWQRAAGAPEEGGPWAKTDGRKAQWHILQGYRHEFGSLVQLEKRNDLPEATRDLIMHLVAAHHGRARPVLSHQGCADLPPSEAARLAGAAALRFAQLHKDHGPWRLAWLEAVLRAADQRASIMADGVRNG